MKFGVNCIDIDFVISFFIDLFWNLKRFYFLIYNERFCVFEKKFLFYF